MHHRIKLPSVQNPKFQPYNTLPPLKKKLAIYTHTLYTIIVQSCSALRSNVLWCVFSIRDKVYTFFVSVTPNVHIGIDNTTQKTYFCCKYMYANIKYRIEIHQLFATLWFGELFEHLSCGREIKYFMYGKMIFPFLLAFFCLFARFIFAFV